MKRVKIIITDEEGTVLNTVFARSSLAEEANIENMVSHYLERATRKDDAFEAVPTCIDCWEPMPEDDLVRWEENEGGDLPDVCERCAAKAAKAE